MCGISIEQFPGQTSGVEQVPVSGGWGRSVYSPCSILKYVERLRGKVVPFLSAALLRSWKTWEQVPQWPQGLLAHLSSGKDDGAAFNC